jgi:hypothetical protein
MEHGLPISRKSLLGGKKWNTCVSGWRSHQEPQGYSRSFWIYLGAASLIAAGFADFQLIAFHFQKADAFRPSWIPVLYAVAMGVSGGGSLLFGKLFDKVGIRVLVPLTIVSALFAPLVFLGGFWAAFGAALWGLGMGVHESIVPACCRICLDREAALRLRDLHWRVRDCVVRGQRADGSLV